MARIRKITKMNRGMTCNEESKEGKVDGALLNSRKLCNNDRNRLDTFRKDSISTSTQTNYSCNEEETFTISTQTNVWVRKDENFEETMKNRASSSKSDSSLLKNIIVLHKNANIEKPIKKDKITKNQRRRKYLNKKYKREFHPHKINRKLMLDNNEVITNSFHKFMDELRKYSLVAICQWSSKLFKMFSDFGLSLTESFANLYKYYESQRCRSLYTTCNCRDFHEKIDHLVWKLNQLESSLNESQTEIKEQQKRIDNTEYREKKMGEIMLKLESYDSLKSEFDNIKKNLNGNSESSTTVAPPLPPPPPPLPMFSLTTSCSARTLLKVVQNESKLINYENPRPIITLEDILNVKLKKISVTNI